MPIPARQYHAKYHRAAISTEGQQERQRPPDRVFLIRRGAWRLHYRFTNVPRPGTMTASPASTRILTAASAVGLLTSYSC